jgi:BirA family biotin operon repressor/biotin-[acetyl-CoA-carboxylase] ligase
MLLSYNIVAKIKWPNDIYSKNGKIAGILIENAIQNDKIKYSVLGVGLNVNQEVFPENISNPSSMMIELKVPLNREDVLKKLLKSIEYWINKLYFQDLDIIKDQYEQQLLFRNKLKEFYAGDDIFAGTIKGINETGQLLIADKSNSVKAYNFKEVKYYLKKK